MEEIKGTLDLAVKSLLQNQNKDGWWKGELETNVSIEAEDLLMRQFLGISDSEITASTARWIRSKMRPDGTWSNFYGGTAELSTTTEAYIALKLAGDSMDAKHMRIIREFILDSGGIEKTRVFTRIWMAIFGEWNYNQLPSLLPEMILLPRWFAFNVYNFACWARQTIVPLTIVGALRPVRKVLPFDIKELNTGQIPNERQKQGILSRKRILQRMDRLVGAYQHIALPPVRRMAIKKSEKWILDRQEADGSWGGIQPPWVYSVLALSVLGYPLDHPAIQKALACIDSFEVKDGDMRRLECCQSPVWDTALAVVGLVDAGLEPNHPALSKAGEWLLSKENNTKGDWSVKRKKLEPGGWAFEFENENYPDVDDTAEVILALDRLEELKGAESAIERGLKWTEGMQSKGGGYGAFDANNTKKIVESLPFCDFGAVIDPPTEDVTAHAIEMLARLDKKESGKYEVNKQALDEAVKWLLSQQKSDGSWFGRWGCNFIYGVGAVVPALIDAGVPKDHKSITASVSWLKSVQNEDGGWGEDMRSYRDLEWAGKGESTPSQTSWAVMALIAAEEIELARHGVNWLVKNQKPDGSWDEPFFTGTGFPGDFYINYHLYRDIFPVTAIGRYLSYLEAG